MCEVDLVNHEHNGRLRKVLVYSLSIRDDEIIIIYHIIIKYKYYMECPLYLSFAFQSHN